PVGAHRQAGGGRGAGGGEKRIAAVSLAVLVFPLEFVVSPFFKPSRRGLPREDFMVMGRYRVLLLLLFGLMLFGCRERGEASPQVLLKVNGREVSHGEFQERFAKTLPQDQQLGVEERAELERTFLVRIVDR